MRKQGRFRETEYKQTDDESSKERNPNNHKSKEELEALKNELAFLNEKCRELTPEELAQAMCGEENTEVGNCGQKPSLNMNGKMFCQCFWL